MFDSGVDVLYRKWRCRSDIDPELELELDHALAIGDDEMLKLF